MEPVVNAVAQPCGFAARRQVGYASPVRVTDDMLVMPSFAYSCTTALDILQMDPLTTLI